MTNKPHHHLLLLVLLLLFLCGLAHCRFITYHPSSSDLISDGVPTTTTTTSYLRWGPNFFSLGDESCEQTYGFMPCSTTALGNLFLILVYGYVMFLSATYISNWSEILLEVLEPGIVGGLVLPILGAFPDAMLVLVSGLSGTVETAQNKVSVGMGLLAGSTILLLTVIWGSCVVVGKCDLQGSKAVDRQDTKGIHLTGTGVSTYIWTCYTTRIMAISIIPFFVVQLPQIFSSTSGRHLAVLIALIISLLMLISYCLYQVFQPKIQKKQIAYAKHKHVISGILKHLKMRALGRLLTDDGEPNEEVMRKLFDAIDENKDGQLSASELRAIIIGIQFYELDFDKEDAVQKVIQDFDTSNDNYIDKEEFVNGIKKWLKEAKRAASAQTGSHTMKYLDDFHLQSLREHELLGGEHQSDVENPSRITFKAVLMLLLGTVIATVVSDPLIDAVDNFSDATSIPSFFISFIALPFATISNEAVSMIITANRKKIKTASLTFSELYGKVTMNNLLCISVFLAIVYIRGLTWNFSSEVLVILIVCIVMGGFASFRTMFPLWTCSVAFTLYPFSLALVYVLDYVVGWS